MRIAGAGLLLKNETKANRIPKNLEGQMKFFISHKQEDEEIVKKLALYFKLREVDFYLDLLDSKLTEDGKALTDHIKSNLNNCTDIIVVMSEKTRFSQWVPFEVGIATQMELPIASFLKSEVQLPGFLSYWPRLKTPGDIDKYLDARELVAEKMKILYENRQFASRKNTEIEMFYKQVKSKL